ncbi:MAG: hypothetical protein HUU01_13565 [Saprospiraceae bacterium]|nr:hypothetical protein [Saprospiraceae bacterium]
MQTFESIRARLQTQAAGRFNCNVEALRPEVRLFIDWMSGELSVLHRDLVDSNDAIQKRIELRLRPDVKTRPVPAHALAYAQPRQNNYVLRPDEDVLTIARLGQAAPHQLFFAPLLPVPLIKARVKYTATSHSLNEVVEHTRSRTIFSNATSAFHNGVFWVGIQLDAPLSPDQPLCFYAHWNVKNEARREALYRLLPLVIWQHNEASQPAKMGLWADQQALDQQSARYVDEEFMHLYSIEKSILQQYNHCFVQVRASDLQKTPPPEAISELCGAEILGETIKEDLVWFKLVFPSGIEPGDLEHFSLQLNCFPVLNRRLDRTRDFMPSGNGGIEIISLSNADKGRAALHEIGAYFLGLQRIFSKNTDYKPIVFDHFRKAAAGYYALQHGRIEAGDFRDIQTRIQELTGLLRTHATALNLVPQHTLNQALGHLQNGAEALETALEQSPVKDFHPGYYLHLKVLDSQDMVYVRFWITQGQYANGTCNPGDLMTSERTSVLEGDVAWVVG